MKKLKLEDLRHNINNPLAIIALTAETLARQSGNQDVLNAMSDIKKQVKRISDYLKALEEDNG